MPTELRDTDDARRYLAQAVCLLRTARPDAKSVKTAIEWAFAVISDGQPLLPPGFIADMGHVAFAADAGSARGLPVPAGWSPTLARSYEDHTLGKIYTDYFFERAADALRRYQGKDRAKGLAYVVRQFRERAKLDGVEMSPAVLRGLLTANPAELLAHGYESLAADGPVPVLVEQYESLISASRRLAEVLGPEDAIALEQRTALADLSQYVAHRQILQVAARLESRLPLRPVRPLAGRKEVATKLFEEDAYPIGGYTSISNRGSIESLLHSQLAFMEPTAEDGPDLFDVKFVRDELFYYSRDENQFRRRRRAFAFVFPPTAVNARYKDADVPYQRIVLACGLVLAVVRRLSAWLTTDALRFEFLFVRDGDKKPLADEATLFSILFGELIGRGAAVVEHVASLEIAATTCQRLGRLAQCQVLTFGPDAIPFAPDGAIVNQLLVAGPRPTLLDGRGDAIALTDDDPTDVWAEAAERLLQLWV